MWTTFMDWLKEWPLKDELMSKADFDKIKVVTSVDEAMEALEPDILRFRAENLVPAGDAAAPAKAP